MFANYFYSLEIQCKTWSKNSFGIYNYHIGANMENDIVNTSILISGVDTKILRHERTVELDND